MKKSLFILMFLPFISFSQINSERKAIQKFLDSLHIKINRPIPPPGFKIYYGCDSTVFMKKMKGDSISIMKAGQEADMDMAWLRDELRQPDFNQLEFPRAWTDDGRIIVTRYNETKFLFRHDSLFEGDSDNDVNIDSVSMLVKDFTENKLDSTKFNELVKQMYDRHEKGFRYKFIFNKNMFSKTTTVKVDSKLNFREDTITLMNKKKEKGTTIYMIKIEEHQKQMDLSYTYSFNDKMEFVFWEKCK